MEEKNKKFKFEPQGILTAVFLVVIGIIILICPDTSAGVLVTILSAMIAIAGLVNTIVFFIHKRGTDEPFTGTSLAVGLTLFTVGVILFFVPSILSVALPLIFGVMLLFSGFGSVQTTLEMLHSKEKNWYISLIFSVLILLAGFLAIFNPFGVQRILMIFLGVSLALDGFMTLFSAIVFRNKKTDSNIK